MLPNVRVSITEEITRGSLSLNTFIPLVILKTKTGPIGTDVLVKSQTAFASTFGLPDENTPEAFGLYQYLRSGSAYVVRAASSSAAKGSATISDKVDLISIETKYKTDSLNGEEVHLVYDGSSNKLYLSMTIGSKLVTSIKETINYSTATADVLTEALNKIVDSFNLAQDLVVLENKFVGKTEDDKPDAFTDLSASIAGGVSGNTGIADEDIIALAKKYEGSDLGIDAILAPGFETVTVINGLANVAANSSFLAIASISGDAAAVCSTANTINPNSSLALYAGKVYLNESSNIAVPACVGILPAYVTRDLSSKWLAPAGVTRGTLNDVAGLEPKYTDDDLEALYTNEVPVNGIRRISGRGFIVWGQKTTEQDNSQYQDRINIVRLCKYLTKEIYKISYDYLFEPITGYTYNSWTLRVEAILDEIKSGNGLSDYKVIMDDTLNTEETKRQNKLIGAIRFKPLEAAEYIEIEFVVTDDVEGGNR